MKPGSADMPGERYTEGPARAGRLVAYRGGYGRHAPELAVVCGVSRDGRGGADTPVECMAWGASDPDEYLVDVQLLGDDGHPVAYQGRKWGYGSQVTPAEAEPLLAPAMARLSAATAPR